MLLLAFQPGVPASVAKMAPIPVGQNKRNRWATDTVESGYLTVQHLSTERDDLTRLGLGEASSPMALAREPNAFALRLAPLADLVRHVLGMGSEEQMAASNAAAGTVVAPVKDMHSLGDRAVLNLPGQTSDMPTARMDVTGPDLWAMRLRLTDLDLPPERCHTSCVNHNLVT